MKKSLYYLTLIVLFFSCKEEKKTDNTGSANKRVEIPATLQKLIETANKDSQNIELQIQTITSLDSLGLHKEALAKLDKIITTDSLNNIFWLKRGQICKQMGDTLAAIKAFRYSARVYPTPIAMMELANLYAETKNPLAISICTQLMKMNPSKEYDAQANFFIGVYYSKIANKTLAISYFNKSISEDFHFAEAYIEKGYLLYNDKKFDEALNTFVLLSKNNQMLADGYYWQAKCYEALNKKQEAIGLYEKTLQLDASIEEATTAINRLKK